MLSPITPNKIKANKKHYLLLYIEFRYGILYSFIRVHGWGLHDVLLCKSNLPGNFWNSQIIKSIA